MRIVWLLATSALFFACSSSSSPMSPSQPEANSPSTNDTDTSESVDDDAGGQTSPGDAGAPMDASTPPRGLSVGCASKTGKTGLQTRTMKVGGKDREYVRFVPDTYVPGKAVALVLGFHGSGGTGPKARAQFDLEAQAKGKAIFIYPTALPSPDPQYDGANRWLLDKDSDDQKFVDMLIDEAEKGYCVDRDREFATGFSMGAVMTSLLGCRRGDVLRAIAPVAPGIASDQVKDCVGNVALWEAWGTMDAEHDVGAHAVRDKYLQANGCSSTTSKTSIPQCVAYQGCREGLPVTWCEHDGAHVWPDFAAQGVWGFFNALKGP